MDRLYTPEPDGLCGDEDNGQTSAWYVFSALGMYPVCPGTGEYVLGSPLFDRATLHLENGKTFTISARDNGPENVYVKSAKLNGGPYSKTYIRHQDIMQGGGLSYTMSDAPNKRRGTRPQDAPYSMSVAEQ